jgi:predicted SnoaL-like aldol condensation-catalyzing enzyme
MKRIVVRYKLKPNHAEENIAYIQKVFEELAETAPDGVRYASFRLDGGLRFVHFASIETNDGSNPLTNIDSFREFTQDIADRCDEPPIATELETVGAYRVFECP